MWEVVSHISMERWDRGGKKPLVISGSERNNICGVEAIL
jgi:hypothetical protein